MFFEEKGLRKREGQNGDSWFVCFFFGLSCSMELVKKKENENEISVMNRWVFG